MFPAASASLLLSLGFGVAAIEFAPLQSLLLTAACSAAAAVCWRLEALSEEVTSRPRGQRLLAAPIRASLVSRKLRAGNRINRLTTDNR